MKISSAILLLHSRQDSAGTLPELLDSLSIEVEIAYIDQPLPTPAEEQLVVVMGSIESAYDHTLPWLTRELKWLKSLTDRDHPVLGICFGSQLLARALGGETYRNHAAEIGWIPVRTTDTRLLSSGPWFNFHFDAFHAPVHATLLASTDMAHQAFIHRSQVGVQFHPEITPEMFDSWLAAWDATESGRAYLARSGDMPLRLREQIVDHEKDNRKRFKEFLVSMIERMTDS
ncbi:glutamine amidotransferase [Litchfieldella qijiaojingensis]|uniref:Glutamine amidotransferase n=1 Tax=Litchfieldella qijiaojingensis TaxID=980347 RepID=A0ABQ2YXL0_9GAMM|nr:type 1 glutamine amidotransferase [Halomonas qijiaojingensis]GGX98649.1 glutamine amidotransferase [Halomonas qijiaojingensis]